MKRLIILRGPAGSGKSSVSRSIRELVGKDTACILDLDITHPQEIKSNQNLEEWLRYRTVVGEMFYANSHTTDPDKWLGKFRNHDYRILSLFYMLTKNYVLRDVIAILAVLLDSNRVQIYCNLRLLQKFYLLN
jgi:pantothenate kinase-related protein Tda10